MLKLVLLSVILAVATASVVKRSVSPTGRIVGGEATTIEEVPYQVALRLFSSAICGATIISENWILTAAHCTTYPRIWYSIRAGSTRSNTGGSTHSVTTLINHAGYASTDIGIPYNDISLLRVDTITLDSTRQAISLYNANEEATPGLSAVITGWGTTSEGGSATTILQTVTIPIISKADCNAAYSNWGGLPDGQICAAYPEGGKDACQGDSGGPLAIDGRLAGVVSWGNGCARVGQPGAYSEVAYYREWITENSGV